MEIKRTWRRIQGGPWVTYLFLLVCVAMFIGTFGLTRTGLDWGSALLLLGAKYNIAIVIRNEWWRLVTAVFLHADLQHIALNSVSFYFLGQELEPLMGKWRFLLLSLGAGIGGNIVSFAFSNYNSVSIVASGAVFGLFASYLALSYLYPDSYSLSARAQNYAALIVINLVFSFLSPGIDFFGHLGGAFYGVGLTYVLQLPHSFRRTWWHRLLALLVILAISAGLIYFGIVRFNNSLIYR